MFDLFRSRDKAVRIMLGGLLGIVALSMLVYLIPGAGMPTGSGDSEVVADIGDMHLTAHDIEADLQSKMRSRQFPPDIVAMIIPQQIDEMIAARAIAYEARRMGFRVSDADLATVIRGYPNFANLTPQQYQEALASQGITVAEFEDDLRKEQYGLALQNLALEGVIVTPQQVEKEFRYRNQKAKLEYVGFSPVALMADVKYTPEDLKKYFEKNKNFFNLPETRAVDLIVAEQAKVAASIQLPDSQLLAYYNANQDQFRTHDRVMARHILVGFAGHPDSDKPKLLAKAQDLLKQIKAGGDFAKLAEKNSDDSSNAPKGGDLGWVEHGQMVKPFEDAIFALKPGEVSGIITTQFGYHIAQVTDKQIAHLQSFDEVKAQIAANLKKQQVNDRMQSLMDQARAALVKAPHNAKQIADQLGLTYASADKLKPGSPLPVVGSDKGMDAAVTSLKKDEVSPVQQSFDKLVVAVVTNIYPPHPPTFEEVQDQLPAQYKQQESVELVKQRAAKMAELMKSNGGDIHAAAKAMGLEVKTTDDFSRYGAAEGLGSATGLTDAFDKPVGSWFGPLNLGSQTIVAKIVEQIPADMSKLPAERSSIVTQLKSKLSQERQELLEDAIVNKLSQEGKIKKHNDVINRMIARYRS